MKGKSATTMGVVMHAESKGSAKACFWDVGKANQIADQFKFFD
jgi:hypothetical protein